MVTSAAVIRIHPEKLLTKENAAQKSTPKKKTIKQGLNSDAYDQRKVTERGSCFALLNQKQLLDVDRKRKPFMGI